MKNRLSDLNNHLFTQLERLNDEDLTNSPEALKTEIERAKAVSSLSKEIVSTGRLLLDAHKAVSEGMFSKEAGPLPKMLTSKASPNEEKA